MKTTKLFAAMLAGCLFGNAAVFAEKQPSALKCLETSAQAGNLSCDKNSESAAPSAASGQKPSTLLKRANKRRKGKKDNLKRPKKKKGKKDNLKRPKGKKGKKDNLKKKK